MLLFDSLFSEAHSKEIMYKGKKVQRIFNIRNLGKYRIRFTFVKTNSPYTQVIKVFFVDFRGEIYLEGRKIQPSRGKFSQLAFLRIRLPNSSNWKFISRRENCLSAMPLIPLEPINSPTR